MRPLIVTTYMVLIVLAGCATPPGVIFEPMDPPIAWPASPQQARIQYLGAIAGGADLKPGRSGAESFWSAFRGPKPQYRLGTPHAIVIQGDEVFVTSPASGIVHILNLETREHRRLWQAGDQRLIAPVGVAVSPQAIYVTDSTLGCVLVYDRAGQFMRRLGGDALTRPTGIVYVPSRDALYVLDSATDQCVVLDRSGAEIARFGESGTGPGQFNRPAHLTFQQPDSLWITDTLNCRVQRVDLSGSLQGGFGQRGDGSGDFSLPKGIAVDTDGHVYVVDAHFENVQIFDAAGQLLIAFGGPGSAAGSLSLPAGLAIDAQNRIWVADAYHHRIAVYQYLPDLTQLAEVEEVAVPRRKWGRGQCI
ncbi:MAG: hypothetical protein IID37_13320 [Planctomycetes bacterium]|nr:hypothetical protein [Planctomycetota bacterium]